VLVLTFKIGADLYGLPAAAIEEVIALVHLRPIEDAPRGVAGDFNYHGVMVPAIDLCQLILDRPSHRRWSTRILLTRLAETDPPGKLIGLISENATELISVSEDTASSRQSVRLLRLEEHFEEGHREFFVQHETTPPVGMESPLVSAEAAEPAEPAEPENKLALSPAQPQALPSPESPAPARPRRRRQPRFSYLHPK